MIQGEHCYIRGAEPDDAPQFYQLYDMRRPRAALLDQRREPLLPTVMELRESLARKDATAAWIYSIEDLEGCVRGFCMMRGANYEVGFTEAGFLLHDDADFSTPMMDEVADFAETRAFHRLRVNKIVAHCLDSETALRAFLGKRGFTFNGAQRDAFYGCGCWHAIEAYTLWSPAGAGSIAVPGAEAL